MANQVTTTQEPTLADVMARLAQLEKENQILKVQATTGAPKKKATTTVKINSKGGVFFSAPCMQAYSETKMKTYQCGINIHGYQLEAFYAFMQDDKLQQQVIDVLKQTVKASA